MYGVTLKSRDVVHAQYCHFRELRTVHEGRGCTGPVEHVPPW